MARIPAYCSNCGLLFPSGIAATNVKNLTLAGNKQNCPRCGHMAGIVDGVFNVADDLIEVIKAPDFTVEVLQKLQVLVSQPINTNDDVEAIAKSADLLHPGFGKAVRKANIHGVWLFLIAAVLALSKCVSMNMEVDVNKLIDQIWQEQLQDFENPKKDESADDADRL